MRDKKKIAIVYPYFRAGGGESVTAWVIEALKSEGDVFLFTCDKINVDILNKIYGVNLSPEDVKIINPPFSSLFSIIPGVGLLKYHFLIKHFKHQKEKFDIVIGTYKETDFGKKGIQYVHFPELKHDLQNLGFFSKIYYKYSFIKNLYKNLCYFISGFNEDRMRKNITLTNSNWTREMIKKNMEMDNIVLYPPVLDDFIDTPWEERKDDFICISRISPEKRIKLIIEIIKAVRDKGYSIGLHIIGSVGDKSYFKEIKKIQKENNWIKISGFMDRKSFVSIVSSYKYGIHGRKDEHFGISVAEMVKAGCIVFVPNDGGQIEIIGNKDLIFSERKDAVEKIIRILADKKFQLEKRNNLLLTRQKFSIENFKKNIREVIKKL